MWRRASVKAHDAPACERRSQRLSFSPHRAVHIEQHSLWIGHQLRDLLRDVTSKGRIVRRGVDKCLPASGSQLCIERHHISADGVVLPPHWYRDEYLSHSKFSRPALSFRLLSLLTRNDVVRSHHIVVFVFSDVTVPDIGESLVQSGESLLPHLPKRTATSEVIDRAVHSSPSPFQRGGGQQAV